MKSLAIIAVALTGALVVGGCKLTNYKDLDRALNGYSDANTGLTIGEAGDSKTYQKGPATLGVGNLRELTIDWLGDSVSVKAYDGNEVQLSETANIALVDTTTLHYTLTPEGELKICFCRPGTRIKAKDMPEKHLLVLLPRTLCLDEVEVNGISQRVAIDEICCKSLELNGVTDCTMLSRCRMKHLESSSVDGNLEAVFDQLPEDIELNNVSGSIVFHIPSDAGMTIEMDGPKTRLHSDLPFRKRGGDWVLGNGACKVEVSSVGGEIFVKQNL